MKEKLRALSQKTVSVLRDCFLFQRSGAELPVARRRWFVVWNWGMVVLMALLLGVLSLTLAYGSRPVAVFLGYFRMPLLLLNLLPPLLLMLILYVATGRAWIAWLITSLLTLIPSAVNYYMLSFRDDTLTAAKVLLVREGVAIMSNYTLEVSARIVLCLVAIPLGTLLLLFFVRGRIGWRTRLIALAALLLSIWPASLLYTSETIYEAYTENYTHLTRKRAADRFIGKGFWYPFLHSFGELLEPEEPTVQPEVEGTGEEATVTVTVPQKEEPGEPGESGAAEQEPIPTVTYTGTDIPAEQKVDVVMIMLEAFSDLTTLGIEGIAPEIYDPWHALEAESYHGQLLTNIFAAGTVNTERCVLTGDFWVPEDGYSKDAETYVRYLAGQGYTVTGSHPIYGWFYDRENINRHLGFESYRFWEGHYETMVTDIAEYLYRDDLFLRDVYDLYLTGTGRRETLAADGSVELVNSQPYIPAAVFEGLAEGSTPEGVAELAQLAESRRKPYFGFHVTYQGHAKYSDTALSWGAAHYAAPEGVSMETSNILNNYLGSIRDTVEELTVLKERLAAQEEPVVLVLFGDHKPWLGDGNSVYHELGINIDTDTEEGFYNYYATPYLIWANDAAKALLENDFNGEGPDISPAYLMNELFDLCGWEGSAYMQLMDDLQELIPVMNTDGYFIEGETFVETLNEENQRALDGVRQVADVRRSHVGDMKIVMEELPCPTVN